MPCPSPTAGSPVPATSATAIPVRPRRAKAAPASTGTADDELEVVEEFTGVRCNSSDRAPLIGPCGPGLHVSAAHASSGLLSCPLAGELIAADLTGEPPVLDAELRAMLDPLRFAEGLRD